MSLTSSSTLAQIRAEYKDNADYESAGSATKANAFVVACRFLLIEIPAVSEHAKSARVEYEMTLIQNELNRALKWLATNPAASDSGGVFFSSFEGFRN